MNNYRAELSISYTPETENLFDLELIQEAAENHLCEYIQDFGGLGESDKYELKDIWTKHKIALVTFVVEFATADPETLKNLSYKFEDLGEL